MLLERPEGEHHQHGRQEPPQRELRDEHLQMTQGAPPGLQREVNRPVAQTPQGELLVLAPDCDDLLCEGVQMYLKVDEEEDRDERGYEHEGAERHVSGAVGRNDSPPAGSQFALPRALHLRE